MQPQSDTTTGVGSELLSDAKDVGTSAVNRLHSEVDARKGEAASQVKSVSSAIDNAAGSLDDNAPDWLKSAFRQGADQARKFADAIEQKDSRQIMADVSDFARTSPGTFLAACAAAGFAAARIFQAGGAPANRPRQPGAIGGQPDFGSSTSPSAFGGAGATSSGSGGFGQPGTGRSGASGSDSGSFDRTFPARDSTERSS